MPDQNIPAILAAIPDYADLTPDQQEQLRAMLAGMTERDLPPTVVEAGLRSTARLLREEAARHAPRMESESVRRFMEGNPGARVAQPSRAVPRRETKLRDRERLHDQVAALLIEASDATRRHEMLRVRREMLALDQGHIRRVLGEEGSAMCGAINEWLAEAAHRLNRG